MYNILYLLSYKSQRIFHLLKKKLKQESGVTVAQIWNQNYAKVCFTLIELSNLSLMIV